MRDDRGTTATERPRNRFGAGLILCGALAAIAAGAFSCRDDAPRCYNHEMCEGGSAEAYCEAIEVCAGEAWTEEQRADCADFISENESDDAIDHCGAGVAGYDIECTLFARCTSACDASETDWQP